MSKELIDQGRAIERERIVAYLAHHEARARAAAAEATTEESRTYQATIANAMKAMGEAVGGEFHWRASL
ncbi:hypothetical protein [Demequina pelophila]|uniref:hypothetical protein n=1 Tax=Demequina pelophila TaxID=1638984 RepID=UPI00078445DD|nr:hypothetical protein [Demequina pelophila]